MLRSVAAVVACLTATLFAGELQGADELNPSGRPPQLREGAPANFYVWRDEAGWHIRSTTAGNAHEFQGTVRTIGGTFASMELPRTEGKKKRKKTVDAWAVSADKQTLAIKLNTRGKIDGCDFQLSRDVRYLDFDLRIDGESRADRIFVGKEGAHPAGSTFKLEAVAPNGK
jgi:hypothetical protein